MLFEEHDDTGEAMGEAEKEFRLALDLDGKCAEARVGLSRLRMRDANRGEAISLLREAVSATPRHPMALRELAVVLTMARSPA